MNLKKLNKAKKVLIIDDEESIRKILSIILKTEGYAVTEVKDSKEAIKIISKDSFNLIITEISMPNVDGLTLIKEIETVSPNVPVVVISAIGTKNIIKKVINAGACSYLIKPFDYIKLKNAVRNLIEKV